MEVLDEREWATNTSLEMAVGGAMSVIAVTIGSRLIDSGDFATPFVIKATALLISTVIYWQVFRPVEVSKALEQASGAGELRTTPAGGD